MPDVVCARFCWDRTELRIRVPRFHVMRYGPVPGYPAGRRGFEMAGAWRQLSTPSCSGMICLDGDVAVDHVDLAAMMVAVDADPAAVHVAPARLWPASTHLDGWVWAHGRSGRLSAQDCDNPDRFTFCFTYLPRALIQGCELAAWAYPDVDRKISAAAVAGGLRIKVVREASPKHMNF
jgi:hypothetical protein